MADAGEMMLDDEDAVEAEILGLAHIIDVVAIALAVAALIVADRCAAARARAAEETESHRLSFSLVVAASLPYGTAGDD